PPLGAPRRWTASEDPGQELPVAPRPAMLAGGGDLEVGGELLEQLDVGDQASAGEDPLEEIVAQERAVRHSAVERGAEGVDVVDPLAGEGAFAGEVLVDVRDRGGIRIDPGRPREDALEERAVPLAGQGGGDPRLQHAVPLDDAAEPGVELRPVQGVRQGADQPPGGLPRQPRVGVESEDVADLPRRLEVVSVRASGGAEKGRPGGAPEQPVELLELAAL